MVGGEPGCSASWGSIVKCCVKAAVAGRQWDVCDLADEVAMGAVESLGRPVGAGYHSIKCRGRGQCWRHSNDAMGRGESANGRRQQRDVAGEGQGEASKCVCV